MAKRVKKDFKSRMFGGPEVGRGKPGLIFYERRGSLAVVLNGETVALSADEVAELGWTAVLEDMPEPWERLRCAVLDAAGAITPEPPGECIRITERAWRQAAEALGIEPEGES